MKIVCCYILLFMFLSCHDKQNISKELSILQSSSIILPQGEDLIIHNEDSMFYNEGNKLKYVIYSDSLDCTSCMINNLVSWNSIIENSKNYNGKLVFYFIFSPKKKYLHQINMLIKNSEFKYQVIVDVQKNFMKANPHLPKDKLLSTFLLDENNNVILVGNPVRNKKIREMFYKIIEEKLGKPNDSKPYNN